jgi:GNAT superfamily N-acetyltransferase
MGSADERVRPYLDAVWAQPEREAIFLAEEGGEATGFARVTLTDDGPCPARLETLFVRPERRGIGRQLLERALGWCAEHGADEVALDVLAGNVDAARFYERLGWRVSCPRRGR